MELLAIWQRGFYQECFAFSGIGTEGAGGGFYRRVGVLGCEVAVMEQGTRGSRCDGEGMVLLAMTAAVGALQRGVGGGSALQKGGRGAVVGGEARVWGAWVWGAQVSGGVNDPNVCGLWFQESLPLCMVITPFVLFFCLL
jgi:hypothetical protein